MYVNYRKIAEEYFNKKLGKDEVVHHIDGDRENNEPENLVILKRSQHGKLHGTLLDSLDTWAKNTKKRGKLCNSCLFVRLYEEHPDIWDFNFSERMINMMMRKDIRKDFLEKNDIWKKIIKMFYKDNKEWKKRNFHDCYNLVGDVVVFQK